MAEVPILRRQVTPIVSKAVRRQGAPVDAFRKDISSPAQFALGVAKQGVNMAAVIEREQKEKDVTVTRDYFNKFRLNSNNFYRTEIETKFGQDALNSAATMEKYMAEADKQAQQDLTPDQYSMWTERYLGRRETYIRAAGNYQREQRQLYDDFTLKEGMAATINEAVTGFRDVDDAKANIEVSTQALYGRYGKDVVERKQDQMVDLLHSSMMTSLLTKGTTQSLDAATVYYSANKDEISGKNQAIFEAKLDAQGNNQAAVKAYTDALSAYPEDRTKQNEQLNNIEDKEVRIAAKRYLKEHNAAVDKQEKARSDKNYEESQLFILSKDKTVAEKESHYNNYTGVKKNQLRKMLDDVTKTGDVVTDPRVYDQVARLSKTEFLDANIPNTYGHKLSLADQKHWIDMQKRMREAKPGGSDAKRREIMSSDYFKASLGDIGFREGLEDEKTRAADIRDSASLNWKEEYNKRVGVLLENNGNKHVSDSEAREILRQMRLEVASGEYQPWLFGDKPEEKSEWEHVMQGFRGVKEVLTTAVKTPGRISDFFSANLLANEDTAVYEALADESVNVKPPNVDVNAFYDPLVGMWAVEKDGRILHYKPKNRE